MSFLDAFMAGVRLVESGSLKGGYQAVNRRPRPGGPSLAFGAYQMLFYDPEVHDQSQGFIPFLEFPLLAGHVGYAARVLVV